MGKSNSWPPRMNGSAPYRPDVIQLPVQDAHGLSIRVGLDAAPVGCCSLVAARLHDLHHTS